MPFEPAGPDTVRCTLCSDVIPTAELPTHVCLPAAVRARRDAGQSVVGPDGAPTPIPQAEAGVPGGVYGAEAREERQEPVTFKLAGQEFRGVDELSLGLQMDLAAAWEENEVATKTVVALMQGIVHPADEKRFQRLIYAKNVTIDATELRDALVSVIRQLAGRPSPSPSPSPLGPTAGGDGSTGPVSSPGWTPGPSPSAGG